MFSEQCSLNMVLTNARHRSQETLPLVTRKIAAVRNGVGLTLLPGRRLFVAWLACGAAYLPLSGRRFSSATALSRPVASWKSSVI